MITGAEALQMHHGLAASNSSSGNSNNSADQPPMVVSPVDERTPRPAAAKTDRCLRVLTVKKSCILVVHLQCTAGCSFFGDVVLTMSPGDEPYPFVPVLVYEG